MKVKKRKPLENKGIRSIKVKGFKSFLKESKIDIKPLTILAGSNSSGKSSIFQPILLMKQTLDEIYDPGALQLNGPNVKFSNTSQLISKGSEKEEFYVEIENSNEVQIGVTYNKPDRDKAGFEIAQMTYKDNDVNLEISLNSNVEDIEKLSSVFPGPFKEIFESKEFKSKIIRDRCFLDFAVFESSRNTTVFRRSLVGYFETCIREILHLPGLRGNPERNYPVTAVDFQKSNFPGTFEKYVASIIAHWKYTKNEKILGRLIKYLKQLGLANNIVAKYINDTEISLHVSRYNFSDEADDIVSIADVGLGLSQTLPILVALLVAKKNQIVYIEQPEIHLHPRAQYELAGIFAEAIRNGVKLIIETHSSIFIRAIQTLVVTERIDHDDVKLHWFLREKKSGFSYINSADLDENGSFGEWPEDFDDTIIMAESRYLDAVEQRLLNE